MTEPRNRRILLVDEEPQIHRDLTEILGSPSGASAPQTPSYDVDSAYGTSDAVTRVKERLARGERYALAFVEMSPRAGGQGSGAQTIADLWATDPDIEVVACTPPSEPPGGATLDHFGAGDRLLLLRKPFDRAELGQVARVLTEKWRLARQAHAGLGQLKEVAEAHMQELQAGNQRLRAEIAERAQVEAALRVSEARYALAAAGANDGLWDWDLRGGSLYFSARWKAILGFADDEIGSRPEEWLGRVHPDDLANVNASLVCHLAGDTEHLQVEYRIRHKDGQHRWMLCRGLAVRDASGVATRIAGSQTDITDRRLAEEQLRYDALHDALTGLANRSLLIDHLNRCLLRCKRNPNHHFAVLFADLDRFKLINDSLGHVVGDQLLVEISGRLLQCIRATDSIAHLEQSDVARLGGDEFVVLIDGMRGDTDVLRVAKRMQHVLSEPFVIDGKEVFTGMSIGIAVGRPEYETPEEILRDADTALYQAKANGRGGCEFFDTTMRATAMSRWWLENALRRAVERNELRLCYQPIISVGTGELREFEALLRWQHPVRGPISPAEFIPVAEETGLIVQIGEWVLRQAVGQLALWREHFGARPEFSVAVNVSSKQLSQPELGDLISRLLSEQDIPPGRLRLEVTESALMDRGLSSKMLARLVDLDLRLHLDDFGTGYSSLSYLHQLPVDALKIDRSFIADMMNDGTAASIVGSVIALAHALGAQVIAEGVESREQLDQLRRLACDWAQGYHFSRPLEVDQATALLTPPPAPTAAAPAAAGAPPWLAAGR